MELLLEVVVWPLVRLMFYWPGWLFLRGLSFGRYPPRQTEVHDRDAVALFAIVAFASVCAIFYAVSR